MTRNKIIRASHTDEDTSRSQSDVEAPSTAPSSSGLRIRILTHNIRYATTSPFKGEEKWPIRCPRLCSELTFNSFEPSTFICLQEVLHEQLWDIMHSLNDTATANGKWAYIGVGRDDGKRAGEYSPIFYRPAVWKPLDWDTFWLSPTPREPSKGWDAASTRIVTTAHFRHVETGKKVIVATTHFDDQGKVSRKESAKLILGVLEVYAAFSGASACFLAGDFNSPPDDEAYKVMTSEESLMADVSGLVPRERHYGNEMTFTGFDVDSIPTRIDFIFSRKGDNVTFDSYAVLANRFDDGVYCSDHRAVVADLHLLP
jgi:endonuclease/exonuclease/phosphatase family metal-dependent hydrolase